MSEFLKIYPKNPNPKAIQKVVDCLNNGGIVIYPTDTVYAMACSLIQHKALERLAKLKGVKLQKANFSLVCSDLSHLSSYTKALDSNVFKLLKRSLPGPYTFILPAINKLTTGLKKRKEIGIRIPDHSVCLDLIKALQSPLLSTSIKDEDEIIEYSTDPELIYEKWHKHVDLIIDSGYGGNIPSTVIDATDSSDIKVIREGKGSLDIL